MSLDLDLVKQQLLHCKATSYNMSVLYPVAKC